MLPLELRSVAEGPSFGSIHVQSDDLGCGRARRPAVRAAAAGRLARKQRHAAAQRLDHGLRRRLRSRPVGAAPPRDRAVRTHGRRRDRDRRRARAGRPLRPLRGGTHRRRIPLRAGALRPAAAGRRDRARREPARRRATHRRRSRGRPGGRANRRLARRPAARRGAAGADRGCDRARGRRPRLGGRRPDHALRRRPLPLLRAGEDRPGREGHPVRPRRDRPARPSRVAVREEPCRQGARASRRTAGCFPSRR